MREVLPLLILRNRVLHIVFETPLQSSLRRGGMYAIKTPDGEVLNVKILDRVNNGLSEIYPLMLCGKDPHKFVESVCIDPNNPKRKNKVVVDFLHEDGSRVDHVSGLELHP